MADAKISELPTASAIAGTEELPVVQSGATKKTTPNALQTYISTSFVSSVDLTNHTNLTSGAHGISAFGATLVDDTDATAARTTLGLSAIASTGAYSDLSGTPTTLAGYGITDAASDVELSTHAGLTSGVHGISAFGATLVDDADAAAARTTLGVDIAGTDNSTPVTLAGAYDYLTISGQQITRGQIDLATDVTGVLPVANYATGTPDGTKFVRDDGTLQSIPGGGDALTTNPLSQFAATTSAQLRGVLTDETGTGAAYFQGGALGTPSSGTLSSCTGLPLSTGVTGPTPTIKTFLTSPTSSNFWSALSSSSGSGLVVFDTSPTLITPDIGTPTSGTLTNCTGLPISTGVEGLGTGVATALAVNVGSAGAFGRLIAAGTAAMNTSEIASGASATLVTVAASGVATTDVIDWGFNGNPNSITGYSAASTSGCLVITAYPTANNVNFLVSNPTAGAITPGALTLNWKVVR